MQSIIRFGLVERNYSDEVLNDRSNKFIPRESRSTLGRDQGNFGYFWQANDTQSHKHCHTARADVSCHRGESGCGKTVSLETTLGIDEANYRQIMFDGIDIIA